MSQEKVLVCLWVVVVSFLQWESWGLAGGAEVSLFFLRT